MVSVAKTGELGKSSPLILHPEFALLQACSETLRSQLAQLLEQRAELEEVTRPYLEALYLQALGEAELQLLMAQAGNARLRRQIDLIRAILNRKEPLDSAAVQRIQRQLDTEMKIWLERLAAQEQNLNSARQLLQADSLSADQIKRLKTSYRKLVRLLHPDVTGGETALYKRYWQSVQNAYGNADFAYLEVVLEVIQRQADTSSAQPPLLMENIRDEIARLESLLEVQLMHLAELYTLPPFCYQTQLRDNAWIAAKQDELYNRISIEEQLKPKLEQLLQQLLAEHCADSITLH